MKLDILRKKVKNIVNNKWTNLLIAFLILLSVVLVLYEETCPLTASEEAVFDWIWSILILIFVVELLLRAWTYKDKIQFIKDYWIDMLAVVFLFRGSKGSILRSLRLLSLVRIAGIGTILSRRLQLAFVEKANMKYALFLIIVAVIVLLSTVGYYNYDLKNAPAETSVTTESKPMRAFWVSLYSLIVGEYVTDFPKSLPGKIVIIAVMFTGMSLFALLTGTVSAVMINQIQNSERRAMKMIKLLENHIVICGWNTLGNIIIEEYHCDESEENDYIVIIADLEKKPEFDSSIVKAEKIFLINEDFTNIDSLKKANIEKASTAIILADDSGGRKHEDIDARTVLTALTIEKINPEIYTCAELIHRANVPHLKMGGVDDIIISKVYAGRLMALSALNSGLTAVFNELLTYGYGNQFYKLPAPSVIHGMAFSKALNILKEQYNWILIGIEQREGKNTIMNPENYTVLNTDSIIIIASKIGNYKA